MLKLKEKVMSKEESTAKTKVYEKLKVKVKQINLKKEPKLSKQPSPDPYFDSMQEYLVNLP